MTVESKESVLSRWSRRKSEARTETTLESEALEQDDQIWWHAIQIARQTFPSNLRPMAQEVLATTTDDRKRREFKSLIKEIDQRSRQ